MMKQYRNPVLLIVLVLSLTLAGCGAGQTGSGISTEAPASEPQNNAEPEAGEQALSVEIRDVGEEDVGEGDYWQYTADEDGIYLAILPDATVYSFKFVAVHVEDAASGLEYVIDEERYAIEELTPDKPFLVKMQFAGLLPNYGVVFEDQNNRERFYTVNMKGTDPEESYPYYLEEIEQF